MASAPSPGSSIEILPTALPTNSRPPTGGVSRPIDRFTIAIMPKCTGSTPMDFTNWHQDRREDQDERRHVHHGAENQHHDVHAQRSST